MDDDDVSDSDYISVTSSDIINFSFFTLTDSLFLRGSFKSNIQYSIYHNYLLYTLLIHDVLSVVLGLSVEI